MDFSTDFLLQSSLAACFSLLFFGLPGILSAALLGLTKRFNSITLLITPALGLCTFGPVVLFCTWLLGYSIFSVLFVWFFYLLSCFLLLTKQQQRWCRQFLSPHSYWLIFAAMCWAVVPVVNIYPAIYEHGLFVNGQIFDHMKIAIVDSIVREGMPPLNPYYAPAGERIELVYYYAWHFDASLIKLLTGVSAWQAEVACVWFTSFAAVSFLMALVVRLTGKYYSGFLLLLLALTGPPAEILPHIVGHRWQQWVGYPNTHSLELLWIQLSWAPQHVFSALCSIVLFYLVSVVLLYKNLRWQYAVMIGLTAAAGFGASVWVGGVALAIIAPFLLLALFRFVSDIAKMLGPLLLALMMCIIFSLPVLTAIISGPSTPAEPGTRTLAIKSYLATGLFDKKSVLEQLGHIILYWLQFLPLNLGIVYLLGFLAMFTCRPKQPNKQLFFRISCFVIIAYLLVIQFVQSDIVNNDFGWRAAMVPIFLLLIWATTLLTQLAERTLSCHTFAFRYQQVLMPIAWAGLTLGLMSSFFSWHWPKPHPHYNAPNPTDQAWRVDFFRLNSAWQEIRGLTLEHDLVQSNPDGYLRVVTPWPAPAALALFGNRPTAYTEAESVHVFAHSYSKQQKNNQYNAIKALFAANPAVEKLAYARDTLNIKALLVDYHDPVWSSHAIEDSGIYRLVKQNPYYKIYLAE